MTLLSAVKRDKRNGQCKSLLYMVFLVLFVNFFSMICFAYNLSYTQICVRYYIKTKNCGSKNKIDLLTDFLFTFLLYSIINVNTSYEV